MSKIEQMHALYGAREDKQCKTCSCFIRIRYGKIYRKCTRYGVTGSNATDWNSTFTACGKYNINFNEQTEHTVYAYIKNKKQRQKETIVLENQISITDILKGEQKK